MADQYVVAGLVRKRAGLAGEIEHTYERLQKMVADLETLDATLQMFAPEIETEAIRPRAFRPPEDWSRRGEMTRICLTILRQATEPLTTRDIAIELLVTRALDRNDQKLLKLMSKRVGVALRLQRDKGAVRSEQGPGQYTLWEMARGG